MKPAIPALLEAVPSQHLTFTTRRTPPPARHRWAATVHAPTVNAQATGTGRTKTEARDNARDNLLRLFTPTSRKR